MIVLTDKQPKRPEVHLHSSAVHQQGISVFVCTADVKDRKWDKDDTKESNSK